MRKDLITLFVTLCVCGIGLYAATTGRLYTTKGNFATAGSSSEYTLLATAASVCAIWCHTDVFCATFWFDPATKLCHMSKQLLIGLMFGPHMVCPVGYQIFVREKNALCLKYYPIQLSQTSATTVCGNDGARLVLIQDDSMLQLVGNVVEENGWGEVWINGFDADDDGNFETSEGKPLPYIPPGSEMKDDPDRLCIRLMEPAPYIFNDLSCSLDARYVLCEVAE